MGLRSSSHVTGVVLGTGETYEFFHNLGNRPEKNDALNIFVTGPASSGANSFQMRLGIPSGPMVLRGFNLDSFPHASNVLMVGNCCCAGRKAGNVSLCKGRMSQATET